MITLTQTTKMLTLLKSKVAIRPIGDPDKIGSLYTASAYKQRAEQGIVKYVGPDVRVLKPGDYVIFSGYSGTTLVISGEHNLIVIPEEGIEAILHPPDTEISGLYHKDKDGNYFPATYESSIDLIRDQYYELPRVANRKL
jgi:co-chaperonin GroES (HSP10)